MPKTTPSPRKSGALQPLETGAKPGLKDANLAGSNLSTPGLAATGLSTSGLMGVTSKSSAQPSTTRWKQIADSVQRDIEEGRLVVGDLLPSETLLTEKWKVSRMTAHRAMQELQRSGLVTRQRGRGTLVAGNTPKLTGNVALLFHSPLDRLEVEYMRGINLGLSEEYQVIFCDSHADAGRESHYLEKMLTEADGIICMPSCNPENTPLLRKIVESGFPIVCVDRVPLGLEIDGVVTDNYGASVAAMRHLVARGHKSVAHLTGELQYVSAVWERHQAFTDVMREAGEADPERLVRYFSTGAGKSFESMVQHMHDALFTLRHQSNPPTAVFCVNDYCLTVLLAVLEKMDSKEMEDLEILTFHDALTLMPSVTARLHRLVQQPTKIGQMAAETLKKRLAKVDFPHEVLRVDAEMFSLKADTPDLEAQPQNPHNVLAKKRDMSASA